MMYNRYIALKNAKGFFTRSLAAGLLVLAFTGCSCTDNRKPDADKTNQNKDEVADAGVIPVKESVQAAVAHIQSLKDSHVKGKAVFTKVPEGIKVVVDIDGLSPGEHGFHVHECGICEGDGTSACAHFNPTKSKHGGPDSPERHVGDLGNILADEQGHGHYERVDKLISLEGENSILGRSVIVHAGRDDFTSQPSGNSGARIGCGIIEAVP
ncbi:MAG: superoxide dismutase family protein [Chlamydiales bacterium]